MNDNNRNPKHKPALSSLSRGLPSHYVTDIATSQIDKSVDAIQKDRFFRNKLISQQNSVRDHPEHLVVTSDVGSEQFVVNSGHQKKSKPPMTAISDFDACSTPQEA